MSGRPLIAWSLEAIGRAESIAATVIAAPPGSEDRAAEIAAEVGIEASVVSGGETRSGSVAAALEVAREDLIAVHDAARPLVTAELFDRLVAELAAHPDAAAVIAAAAITDTVKRARESRQAKGGFPRGGPTVAGTESRDHLWAAQTPQVFRAEALRDALSADPKVVAAATDEAMLIERNGGKVLIQPSPASNLKVTTPADIRVAELLLSERPR